MGLHNILYIQRKQTYIFTQQMAKLFINVCCMKGVELNPLSITVTHIILEQKYYILCHIINSYTAQSYNFVFVDKSGLL